MYISSKREEFKCVETFAGKAGWADLEHHDEAELVLR